MYILNKTNILNDPLLITLLAVGFVLIAAGFILYFLVFRKKIKEKIAISKQKKAIQAEEDMHSMNLAESLFKEEPVEEKKGLTKEEKKALDARIRTLSNKNYQNEIKKTSSQSVKPKAQKKEEGKKLKNDDDSDSILNVMNQLKGVKTQKKETQKREPKKEEMKKPEDKDKDNDDSNTNLFNVMNQFGKDK